MFRPPYSPLPDCGSRMEQQGFVVLEAAALQAMASAAPGDWPLLAESWADLPLDAYLRDGGKYRQRRHSSFVVEQGRARLVDHRAHWQSTDHNALHGGIERWFEPMSTAVSLHATFDALIVALADLCSRLSSNPTWYVEAHQFRITTSGGIGRPTPEGAHRDGVDYVAILPIARQDIKGGETRVFEADGPNGQRFTLDQPWSLLFLDDARVIHETTPIQALSEGGYRDTLVLTFRRAGFQAPRVPGAAPAQ